jgi:hypothetical protein
MEANKMDISDVVGAQLAAMKAGHPYQKVYVNPVDAERIMQGVTPFKVHSVAVGELFAKAAGLTWFADETVPVGSKRFE